MIVYNNVININVDGSHGSLVKLPSFFNPLVIYDEKLELLTLKLHFLNAYNLFSINLDKRVFVSDFMETSVYVALFYIVNCREKYS